MLRYLLLPLAWLFDGVTRLRNMAFDRGWLRIRRYDVPTIAVGNLSVGGTGKTPHTEMLLAMLTPHWRTAMLSRGYGRRTRGFVRADEGRSAQEVGDEPWQMARKFPTVQVCVCEDRCEGIDRMMREEAPPQVIVLDDAYQHRHVRAGRYILLTDYARRYTHDLLLPAGRLRESRRGARRADIIIVTKCPPDLTAEAFAGIRDELRPLPHQHVMASTLAYDTPHRLFAATEDGQAALSTDTRLLVVTGIAHPELLLNHLAAQGFDTTPMTFADHHDFTDSQLVRMDAWLASQGEAAAILTTEKDAARFMAHAATLTPRLRQALWVQGIRPRLLFGKEKDLHHLILQYVTENQRNR